MNGVATYPVVSKSGSSSVLYDLNVSFAAYVGAITDVERCQIADFQIDIGDHQSDQAINHDLLIQAIEADFGIPNTNTLAPKGF